MKRWIKYIIDDPEMDWPSHWSNEHIHFAQHGAVCPVHWQQSKTGNERREKGNFSTEFPQFPYNFESTHKWNVLSICPSRNGLHKLYALKTDIYELIIEPLPTKNDATLLVMSLATYYYAQHCYG